MTIEAIITYKDGTVRSLLFDSFEDVGEWYDKRQEHIDTITARMITLFRFDDGTLLRMHYDGAWKAYVQEAGTAHHMIMPLIAGDDYYSDLFTINTDIIQAHWKEKPKEG